MYFKMILTRTEDTCHVCGDHKPKNSNVRYYPKIKAIACIDCPIEDLNTNTMPDPGVTDAENFINREPSRW